ncbi:MAG: OsmC family peroxiredoxin [Bacteroidetes bacterium]|nr:MAG: OsmC family peroxiredoxin [Bacteroidota bacterium]
MKVELTRTDHLFQFDVTSENHSVKVTANPAMSAPDAVGFRPMELLLSSLASCLSIDVLNILYKQRQKVESFAVKVEGTRSDQIPSAFTQIELQFELHGEIENAKIQRAIDLGLERYCSVYHSLSPSIRVECSYSLNA